MYVIEMSFLVESVDLLGDIGELHTASASMFSDGIGLL